MSLDVEQPSATTDSAPSDEPKEGTLEQFAGSDGDADGEGLIAQPDPEDIEEDYEGLKLRGKKDLIDEFKNGRLRQADYTRKTQEVAEQRRAFESERAQFQQQARDHQQNMREYAALVNVEDRLGQFQTLNWQQVNAEDPQRAQALLIEFNQLQSLKGQLSNSLTQRQQQAQMAAQRETARRIQEGQAVLARDIKGWSPELAGKLAEFGASLGIPREALSNVTDPLFVKVLHKAYIGEQLEKKAAAKPAAELPKPATRVGGSSANTTRPLSEITDPREYIDRYRKWQANNR